LEGLGQKKMPDNYPKFKTRKEGPVEESVAVKINVLKAKPLVKNVTPRGRTFHRSQGKEVPKEKFIRKEKKRGTATEKERWQTQSSRHAKPANFGGRKKEYERLKRA